MTLSPDFSQGYLNQVHVGDCVAVMDAMPEGSVNMIFADPPYNLQIGPEYGRGELRRPDDSRVDGVDAAWDKLGGFAEYDRFSERWLRAARRVLKEDGSFWVIGSYHNIFRLGAMLQDLGFWILNDVVWLKSNPMPNFRGRRFTNAHETLIWCGKNPEAKPTFNYEAMKAFNDDLQMRSDWRLPICTGQERLKDDGGRKAHPTQKPEALLYRVVLASSKPGDVVLDPFFGTGTTGAVCKRLGRHWVGIEQDTHYATLATQRIAETPATEDKAMLTVSAKREQPRIPFGALLERSLLKPGDILFDQRRLYSAKVRADATLISAEAKGSIHQVAAAVQGASACNGWAFWFVERSGSLIPIDMLRQKVRAELYGAEAAEPANSEARVEAAEPAETAARSRKGSAKEQEQPKAASKVVAMADHPRRGRRPAATRKTNTAGQYQPA